MRSAVTTRHIAMATALVACLASFAHAHHSDARFYDLCTSVSISGQIERVQWKNPHVLIELRTAAGVTHVAEWLHVPGMTRAGVAPDTLRVGDPIEVTGSPQRPLASIEPGYRYLVDPALKMVGALTEVRRPGDGWNWHRSPGARPAECPSPPPR